MVEFEGKRATHHQGGEWGTDVRHGTRTGVSERLLSTHQVLVQLRHTVERGLCEHDQPSICATSDDGGFLPRLFRVDLGNEGVCSVGFWDGTMVIFWGGWYREWEEKSPRSMEFGLCSLHVVSSNGPNLCIYVLYYVLYYISSHCSGGFADTTACM